MDKTELMARINASPVFYLATLEDGMPRVRAMLLYRADDAGIIFNTGRHKSLCRQIEADPRVEMCFHAPEEQVQVRVRGTVEEIDDPALKDEVVRRFAFLRPWVEDDGMDALVTYRLAHGEARVWYAEDRSRPEERLVF